MSEPETNLDVIQELRKAALELAEATGQTTAAAVEVAACKAEMIYLKYFMCIGDSVPYAHGSGETLVAAKHLAFETWEDHHPNAKLADLRKQADELGFELVARKVKE